MSALIFVGFLAALVLVAFVVSRITGARPHFLEDWKPEPGESILFEDREADTYLVPALGQARFVSYARPRRGFVLVTSRRILAGTRPLFSKRLMIQHVIYVGEAPGPEAGSLGGGLLTKGYQTLVVERDAIQRLVQDVKPYVLLTPASAAASSFNLQAIRIYTDAAADFPLPEPRIQA
jgi:hypothetical protein